MNNLRAIRAERGLALGAVATRSGASTATLVQVERYDYLPRRADTRQRIARALGCTVENVWPELCDRSIDPPSAA